MGPQWFLLTFQKSLGDQSLKRGNEGNAYWAPESGAAGMNPQGILQKGSTISNTLHLLGRAADISTQPGRDQGRGGESAFITM